MFICSILTALVFCFRSFSHLTLPTGTVAGMGSGAAPSTIDLTMRGS
jgi:hypothetical protein